MSGTMNPQRLPLEAKAVGRTADLGCPKQIESHLMSKIRCRYLPPDFLALERTLPVSDF
jgi:hypothetical protein